MTSDQTTSRLAMQGVAVWRNEHPHEGWAIYSDDPRQNPLTLGELGRWHTEAVAQALVDVAEAALAVKVPTADFFNPTVIALDNALEALDAAKAASSSAEGAST